MKSDDMEELFREAAEKYHVDTEKAAAWDDVYDALHGDEQPGPAAPGYKHNKRWLNLLWLLLIPLGWFAHNVWNDIQDNKTVKKQEINVKDNTAGNKDKGSDANTAGIAQAPGNNKTAATSTDGKAVDNSAAQANAKSDNAIIIPRTGNASITTGSHKQMVIAGGSKGKITGSDDKAAPGSAVVSNTPVTTAPAAAQPNVAAPNSSSSTAKVSPAVVPQNSSPVNSNRATTNTAAVTPPAAGNNTTVNSVADNNKPGDNKPKKDNNKKPGIMSGHYFYAGMVGSPDISFIHGQKTSPVGVSAGIIVGYAFNKHLSVETGILYDKKNYYTKGQYFDKNRIEWFKQHPDITVIDMQGNCKMIEVPINVKYTFINKNKNRVYASAGLSTYFMGKEYYDYNLDDWGTQYPKGISYNNHIKNWFSVMNVGVGYERAVGTKTSLRIEPFIKMPVSGVGSGNINLTSTGLYIGVTRRIP